MLQQSTRFKNRKLLDKVKNIFYYGSLGLLSGFLIDILVFFSTTLEMRVPLSLVLYVTTLLGIFIGIFKSKVKRPYLFFILELITVLIAFITNKQVQFLYITKEALGLGGSALAIKPYFIGFVLLVNVINLLIAYSSRRLKKE